MKRLMTYIVLQLNTANDKSAGTILSSRKQKMEWNSNF